MSQYLILLYEDEQAYTDGGQELWDSVYAAHEAFGEKHRASIVGGNGLQPTASATTIRDGGAVVTDGPFAEAKEALGGYYLIEAADLDEALAVARDVPMGTGGVEVRPVMVFD